MELMARYPDNYFDLAIVDPPYGIGESSKNRNGITKLKDKRNGRISYVKTDNEIKDWDNNPPPLEYFIELKRVSKNQIIFGANHFIENIPNANSSSWFIWDKCNGTSDFADCEMAWTSFNGAVRQFRFMWSGMFQGKQSFKNGHIFEGNLSLHEKRIHKTHQPVIIYKWLLEKYAKDLKCDNCGGCGEYSYLIGTDCDYRQCRECKGKGVIKPKILDTHLGSGSIAIACHDYSFELTACELDKEYYDKAVQRIKNHVSQQKLF
jgi:site-specific DNA-methyltransferase (adenine-specific)